MSISDAEIMAFLGQYFWPLCRIAAMLMAMPVIGSQVITARARLMMAIAITALITPLLPPMPSVELLSIDSLIIVIQQVLIGLSIAFTLQVVFQLFVLAGQFIAMKMGLGFAMMNDPANGISVTVISQYYLILVTLLFLSMDGHLLAVDYIVTSFYTLPVSLSGVGAGTFLTIANSGSWMFSGALLIALPVLTSLLVVNIAFGVMSRAAPQMNVFAVGFPITLVFGLVLVWLSAPSFLPNYIRFTEQGFAMVANILGL